jgi:RNase P/RNase MRP subunit p29
MDCHVCHKKNLTDGQMPRQRAFFQLSEQAFRFQLLGAVVIWLLASTCTRADKVVLIDGDTIQGRLVEEDRSKIVLEHRDLGRVTIPKDRIASSKIEAPDATVVLAGGDTIEGKLVERTDSAIVLEHASLGRLEIPRERIDSLKVKAPEFKKEEKAGWLIRG